jgi:hypothetical protein
MISQATNARMASDFVQLLAHFIEHESPDLPCSPDEYINDHLNRLIGNAKYSAWIYYVETKPAGFISASVNNIREGWIEAFYIIREHRGGTAHRELIRAGLKALSGANRVCFRTETLPESYLKRLNKGTKVKSVRVYYASREDCTRCIGEST